MENNRELQATTCETLSHLFKCQHVSFEDLQLVQHISHYPFSYVGLAHSAIT